MSSVTNMLKAILFVGIFLTGSSALFFGVQFCDSENCKALLPKITSDPEDNFPGAEKLKTICPSLLDAVECYFQEMNTCFGQTIHELVKSDNETIAKKANIILGTGNLFIDLCDTNTSLHRGAFALFAPGTCNVEKCRELSPKLNPEDPEDTLPSAERLMSMCPSIRASLDCVFQEIGDCSDGIHELSISDNKTVAAGANILLGVSELFDELCDEDADIHKAYAANVVCIRSVMTNPLTAGLCSLEAKALYGAYKYDSDDEVDSNEAECMIAAHVLACVSAQLLDDCGEGARATLIEMLKLSRVMRYAVCTPENLSNLKSKYIDFLELEADRRNVFEKAFDLRKKK